MSDVREMLITAMNSHSSDARIEAAVNDMQELDGSIDHVHGLHADAIMAAMPEIFAGMHDATVTALEAKVERLEAALEYIASFRTIIPDGENIETPEAASARNALKEANT